MFFLVSNNKDVTLFIYKSDYVYFFFTTKPPKNLKDQQISLNYYT